ncbi:MAG: transposase, partial [Gammaproteobacteria bacterium]
MDSDLERRIKDSPVWRAKEDLLRSVPGIGAVVSRTLRGAARARTPDRRQIAALAGVAPLNRDSGTLRGKRMVWGGRRSVRVALYMAALTASRRNPVIREFYQRFRERGKPPKVALTARQECRAACFWGVGRPGNPPVARASIACYTPDGIQP